MAAKLARSARRQRRFARTHRRSLLNDVLLTRVEQPDASTLCVFALVNGLFVWFRQCPWIHLFVGFICMAIFWCPLIQSSYIRKCNERRAFLQQHGSRTNFTRPCMIEADGQPDGLSGEASFAFFTRLCCTSTAGVTVCPVLFQALLPTIEHKHRRRVFLHFQVIFSTLIASSLFNQLASAFAIRPLAMFFDLRFLSMLGMQWIGFGLCLVSAFISGVMYASARNVKRASTSS